MVTRALEKYIKLSPRKLGLIARLVNRKRVDEALYILASLNKKGAVFFKKALESALNNAKRIPEKNFTEENLYISKAMINPGPTVKRYRAMSMGRAGLIRKRTSHILVELDALKKTGEQSKKRKK